MKVKDNHLLKLAKKLKLDINHIRDIIVYEHELNNLIPRNSLKKTNLDMYPEDYKLINKVANTLKVSESAVIGVLLINYLESKGE